MTLKNVSTIWFQNGDKFVSFSSIVENGQIVSVQWLDDQRGKTDLYCFCLFLLSWICNKGKTLKNVAFAFNKDILGKIIEQGGVCSITVAFDFEKKQTKKKSKLKVGNGNNNQRI